MARNNNEVIEYSESVKEVVSALNDVKGVLKELVGLNKTAFAVPSDTIKAQKDLVELQQANEKLTQQLLRSQKAKEQARKKEVSDAQKILETGKRLNDQKTKEEQATQRLNARLQEQNRAYNQLKTARLQASKNLQDLLATENANIKTVRQARLEYNKLDKQFRTINESMRNYQDNVGNYKSAFGGIGGSLTSLMGAFGIVGGLTMGVNVLKDATKTIIDFDNGMLNVMKTTGLTRKEIDELGGSVIQLSKDLEVVGSVKLTEYMAVAGQLGVKGSENLLKFTEAMAKLETASNISGEEGASSIARLLTLTDKGVQNVKKFGDEIVNLGNNFPATEKEILNSATAIAQNTAVYDLGRQATLAYATALTSVGVEAELSGSKIGKTLKEFEGAILKGGKDLEGFSRVAGLTNQEFTDLFAKDKSDALKRFVEGLNMVKTSGGSVIEVLNSLGLKEERLQRVLSALASEGGYKTLNEALITVKDSTGAMTAEFETASTKLTNDIARVGNKFDNLILTIDSGKGVVSEFIRTGTEGLGFWLDKLTKLVSTSAELKDNMVKAGIATATEKAMSRAEKTGESISNVASQTIKQNLLLIKMQEAEMQRVEERVKRYNGGKTTGLTTNVAYKQAKDQKDALEAQNRALEQLVKDDAKRRADAELAEKERLNKEQEALSKELTDKEKREAERRLKQLEQQRAERLQLIHDYNKQELQTEIDRQKRTLESQATTKAQQAQIEMLYNQRQIEVALKEHNYQLSTISDSDVNAQEKRLAQWAKYYAELERLQNSYARSEKKYNEEINKDLTANADKSLARLKQEKALEAKILQEASDAQKQLARETRAYLDQFSDLGNFGFSSLNKFFDFDKDGLSTFDKLLKGADDWKEQMGVIVASVGSVFQDVYGAMTARSNAYYQNELMQAQYMYEEQLRFVGDNTAAKEELDRQYEEKQKQIKRRQAEADKKQAVFNAIIGTAVGVATAMPNLILASIVAGLGAVQIATIMSTPLPEFYMGTDNAPEGLAWTQERGAEVITNKKGDVKTYGHNKGATLTMLEKGDKVYRSREEYFNHIGGINNVLEGNGISPIVMVNNGITEAEMYKVLSKTLGSQTKESVNFDSKGYSRYLENKNNRLKIMSKR